MKILCDTDTLFHNIDGDDKKSLQERAALEELLRLRESKRILMFRSRVVRAELEATRNPIKKGRLQADYEALDQIPKDENVIGFWQLTDPFGGTVSSNPIVSDFLNEPLYIELKQRGLSERDAHHITHAVGNHCDVFLTRDERTIINPHRKWLEEKFDGLKIRRPSELIAEIEALPSTDTATA